MWIFIDLEQISQQGRKRKKIRLPCFGGGKNKFQWNRQCNDDQLLLFFLLSVEHKFFTAGFLENIFQNQSNNH